MAAPPDDLKWFGEGFDGFPKRLPEDCVEYSIFIVNPKLSAKETFSRVEALRRDAQKLSDALLKDYIWQRDTFKRTQKELNGRPYLHGLTNYGDCVEDEWLIVYILKELSKSNPDAWIKVVDTDGEFLLIEAANALPRWINPEVADNRVWINSGLLYIVPLKVDAQNGGPTRSLSRSLQLNEALEIIAKEKHILIHSPLVEKEAFYRTQKYPQQIAMSMHHSLVTIPRKLAYILHAAPASISPAVEAFYLRDPISLKPLQTASAQLHFPVEDLVTVSVKFTKILFAQLKGQEFPPPAAWKQAFIELDMSTTDREGKAMARLDMGMKVTSGFEMLVGDSKYKDNRSVREIEILLQDLNDGEPLPSDADIAAWPGSSREDDDSWLDINFADFEKELSGKAKKADNDVFGPEMASGFGDAKTQEDLKKIVERFEAFLDDDKAGPDGAELDEMDYDDDEPSDDDSEDEHKEVKLDEKQFARIMKEMIGTRDDFSAAQTPDELVRTFNFKPQGTSLSDDEGEDEENEADQIRNLMEQMEAELTAAGALNLNPPPRRLSAFAKQQDRNQARSIVDIEENDNQSLSEKTKRDKKDSSKRRPSMAEAKAALALAEDDDDNGSEDDDNSAAASDTEGDINIDFNLAKNLLESFKAQAGMAGPGGNLMGLMGVHMPRDEGDPIGNTGNGNVQKSLNKGKGKEVSPPA